MVLRSMSAVALLLLLLALAAAACAESSSSRPGLAAVSNALFPGRSGNVLVEPLLPETRNSKVCFFDNGKSVYVNKGAEAVPATVLANAVCRAFTVLPTERAELDIVRSDVFTQPAANLLIAVEGISGAEEGLFPVIKEENGFCRDVTEDFYPSGPLSLAASMATGSLPSQHGIVGEKWKGTQGVVRAYTDKDSWARRPSFCELISRKLDGNANVVSVGSNPQLAAAFGVSPMLLPRFSAKSYSVTLTADGWSCGEKCPFEEKLTVKALALALSRSMLLKSVHATVKETIVQIANVEYDLQLPAHSNFFAELLFASERLPDIMASLQRTEADIISVSLSGLAQLDVAKSDVSKPLIASAVALLIARMKKVYASNVVSELLFLGNALAIPDATEKIASVLELRRDVVQQYYPALYVPEEHLSFACAVLPSSLESMKLSAVCPAVHAKVFAATESERPAQRVSPQAVADGANPYVPPVVQKGDRAGVYQIIMWTSIMLVLAAALGVYALAGMSFRKDTLLYSSFNPNWEDRKRR